LKIVHDKSLPLRQSYTRTLKGIYRAQRFRNHPKNRKKALKADRQLKTIAGRLVRELERNLEGRNGYEKMFELYYKVLSQNRKSKNKIYSLHEPDVFVSVKARNIRNTSLVIRYPFFAPGQDLFLVHALLGMNTMGIPYKRRWNKPKG
jgi:hypothetical protein